MIPSAWTAAVIALGVFRIVRLIGWDDFPPIVRVRIWLLGASLSGRGSVNSRMGVTNDPDVEEEWAFRRATLEKLIACAYCSGWWLSLLAYLCWVAEPTWTLYALAPFALSAAVGLLAANLD